MTAGPVTTFLPVPAGRAFGILEDPRSFRELVVGARRIRRFDPRWPDVRTKLHHSVGIAPFVLRDTTQVLECEPGRRLVLEARTQAVGRFVVAFDFRPTAGGCCVTVTEAAVQGLAAARPLRPLVDLALHLRNRELGRRYRRIIDRREGGSGRPGRPP